MIVHGHEHLLRPASSYTRPDGSRSVTFVCRGANGAKACSLEMEQVFRDQQPVRVRFRYAGLWLDALEMLRMTPPDVVECPDCHGVEGLVPCMTCVGVGVVGEDERAIRPPAFMVDPD